MMKHLLVTRLFFAMVDATCLLLSFSVAYYLRIHVFPSSGTEQITAFTPYYKLFVVIWAMWIWAAMRARLLDMPDLPFEEEIVRVLSALVMILLMVMLVLGMLKMNYNYSRLVVFGGFGLSFFVITSARAILRKTLALVDGARRTVLLVSGTRELPMAVQRLLHMKSATHNIVGVVLPERLMSEDNSPLETEGLEIPVLGTLDHLDEVLSSNDIQRVSIVLQGLESDEVMDIAVKIEGRLPFMTLHPEPSDILVANSEITVEAGSVNLNLHQNLVNPVFRIAKRVFDIIFASAAIIVLFPVYALIALAIKLDSSGPVFYVQRRLGQDMQPFGCYKFRTMAADAEKRL